jgi:uncharacterized cupin superfamily protein
MTDRQVVSWIEVPQAAMRGQGLRPYVPGEITSLFDWAQNPQGESSHLMLHRSQFIVDIVKVAANAVHQPSKPGDEIVWVLRGVLELTDDAGGKHGGGNVWRFTAGELVLIPLGWAGLYRMIPDGDDFLELALVPGNYFDEAAVHAPTGARPRALEVPIQPGIHELHRGRYVIQGIAEASVATRDYQAAGDEVIYVRHGRLAISAAGRSGLFEAGSIAVLPKGFSGRLESSADYRALIARWPQG